jgi:predicted AlkP superfamily pyrophosphatase or phosphodiesterase
MSNQSRVSLSLIIAFLAFTIPGAAQKRITDLKPTVILISADGFRHDYMDIHKPATINSLASAGVRAKWMESSFPTKTFPNHYTVATGLYPANNGIVDNNIFDFGTVFSMSRREEVENPRWWLGEPIWVTAQKQGQIAGSFFFVGTEAPVMGIRPTFWRNYNGGVPPQMRVDTVLKWLDLPVDKRPTMIAMYFSDPDDAGHEFGPDSEELKYAVKNVDAYIGRLTDGLKARGIFDKVNIILVSDHGMTTQNLKNVTFLDDHFDLGLAERILWSNEMVHIFPKTGKTEEIYERVKGLEKVSCWRKDEIPARFNYKGSNRIAPIVCMSELGWITTNRANYQTWMARTNDKDKPRGAHGYDPKHPDMRAFFVAHGPAFKKRYVAEPFTNVEVYNIMCSILGLKPAKNDGDFDRVKGMMRNGKLPAE